jgi:hypothetical protein
MKPADWAKQAYPQAKPVRRLWPFPISIEGGKATRTLPPKPPTRPALPDALF